LCLNGGHKISGESNFFKAGHGPRHVFALHL
jgi:hypothetical protein